MVSGVPQYSVLVLVLFTADKFSVQCYDEDSTLLAVARSSSDHRAVEDSFIREVEYLGNWWNMKLNPSRTKCLVVNQLID